MSRLIAALVLAAGLAWPATGVQAAGGSLVIVGGALRDDNRAVYAAFVERLLPTGPVLVIPAASGQPARASAALLATLQTHGVAPERLHVFPLAMLDDSSTGDVDESQWQRNAWQQALVAGVRDAAGIWFTGGDQMRIVSLLRDEQSLESPLLKLLRQRLAAGAVIGGSSAGAAIMSADMITGGDSFRALTQPLAEHYTAIEEQDSGRLSMARGLGFFPFGLIDQHFDRKARLGRLVRAMQASDSKRAYGIDEDTALIVDLDREWATVAGSGAVTLLDASAARFTESGDEVADGLVLGVAHTGVELNLESHALAGDLGAPTTADPYYGYLPPGGGGMALANPRLEQALGYDLLDNSSTLELQRHSTDGSGQHLVYRFRQAAGSQAYWHRGLQTYAVEGVDFSIVRQRH
ncbi:cyanophycinase [Parahaliea aestuarii]|uniref:Cyanophycinase n=1 Tax=Parahaliea aestuarii TaxID=1852021 RepID=A0A5C8ZR91_9GAMM|nr:cyanophycinase [Parahaliea aestuarii]TXS90017.1 cyanophycinase [Parahaliea aestuarii]